MNPPVPRNAYARERLSLRIDPSSDRAKQSFKKESDINNIMRKYQKTGAIDHFNSYQGQYGDVAAIDFQTAMNLSIETQAMFDALPSSIRTRVGNDPAAFLEFVQNPDNRDELIKLGLAQPEPETIVPGPPVDPPGQGSNPAASDSGAAAEQPST